MAFRVSEEFGRFILLSGQDLPIKTNEHIVQFFSNNPHEYLTYREFPVKWWVYGGYDRVQIYNFPDILGPFWNKVNRKLQMLLPFRRPLPIEGPLFGGTSWLNLTRDAVEYILHYVQTTNVLKNIRYSSGIDEIFFQSVLLNSRFAESCKSSDMRYVDWSSSNGSNPKTLDQSDFQKLQDSTALFARKFDLSFDSEIVQSILQMLGREE
jgi:hypothetical protein